MRKNILIFTLFLLFSSFYLNDNKIKFCNIVLQDFERHSYFLKIKISDKNGCVNGIIENYNLYYFLSESTSLTRDDYTNKMLDILLNDSIVDIPKRELKNNNGFFPIIPNTLIDSIYKMGKETFINNYFSKTNYFPYKVLNNNISFEERNYIISKLFDLQVLCKTECETGLLYIIEDVPYQH